MILAAHEIRDTEERIVFFKQLNRALKPTGRIIVVEHLRDWPNFFAYNIGFFHFLSSATWQRTFKKADLTIDKKINITPFITIYSLGHDRTS